MHYTSHISKQPIHHISSIKGRDVRADILLLIQLDFPDFTEESFLSLDELNHYRRKYFRKLVEQEMGELEIIDADVMEAIRNNSILTEKIEEAIEAKLTSGQKFADKIATFGGSWTFIIVFFLFIILWMFSNIWIFTARPFDPYPFILLNLILSCLAAIQAPIIMMSQNRQDQKDRQRAEHDHKINLKAELEIKLLSEKVDHLLVQQNKKLLEIQEVQIDYLEDLLKRLHNAQIKENI